MAQTSNLTGQLRLGHLNVYHLSSKIQDVTSFFNNTHVFHIFGLSETRLKARIPTNHITIPNYSIYRKDASLTNPLHAGLVVYVHNSICMNTRRRVDLESDIVENVWIELTLKNTRCLIGHIYRNPASNPDWFDAFTSMMDKVQNMKCPVIMMGDFNIDYLKNHPVWESTIALFGLHQLVDSPTRVTPTSSTLIDHIYTDHPHIVSSVDVPAIGISDHYSVCCTVSCKDTPLLNKTKHSSIVYRCFKHFNEQSFLLDLSLIPFNYVYNIDDPDLAFSYFIKSFLTIANKHAPLKEKRVRQQTLPPWFTPEIKKAMFTRDTFKKQKQFEEYKKARNRVNNLVRQAKRNYFHKLASSQKDICAMWRAVNTLTGKKHSVNNKFPSRLTPDTLNDFFVSVASRTLEQMQCMRNNEGNYEVPNQLKAFCNRQNPENEALSIPFLSVHEVGKLISKMDNKKSVGLDSINAQLLKLSLPYIVEPLTYIYNLCIQKNIFPTNLKTAKLIPIPKTKTMSDCPSDYRPISILSILSKPLERHIHKHMLDFFEKHNLFHPYQSGFRKYHSCQTAITRLIDLWLNALDKRQMVGTVFLDLSKAFDLVNHNLLMKKLSAYNMSKNTLLLLKSYLTDRTQLVQLNGTHSHEKPVLCGVPQGSILGPLLFCVFINDLPLNISSALVQCDMFADDDTLHASSENVCEIQHELQQSLNKVSEWCSTNLMALNPSKSKCMLIATRQKHQRQLPGLDLNINSKSVEQVSEHRLLGVTVDSQLKWQTHIENICKKIAKNVYLLSKIKDIVNCEAKRMFFFAHIMSHLNYVSNVWDGSAEVHIKLLQSLHKRAVKMLTYGSPPETNIYKKVQILPLKKQLLYNKNVLVYRTLFRKTPSYLRHLITCSERSPGLNHRLRLPKPRIDLYKTSFAFSGSFSWNELPTSVKASRSLPSFKKSVFKYLMNAN